MCDGCWHHIYENKKVNPGLRDVPCETSDYEQPEWIKPQDTRQLRTLFPWGLASQKALREQIWPCSESGRDIVILTILSITMSLIKHGQVCGRGQTALQCQYEQQIGWLRVSLSLQHSLWGRSGWWVEVNRWPNWRRKRGVWTHW